MSKTAELKIEGMHCDACVRRVNVLLKRIEGVEVEHVEVGKAIVKLPEGMDLKEVSGAVEGGGFKVAS